MNPDIIKSMIAAGMPGATIHVEGADGVHFEAVVIASEFAGMRPLQRHRGCMKPSATSSAARSTRCR
jgi:acid stress-induced BolA-like protein IbaG/YrbA